MYRKTGGQPKPSISICPNCQQPKDPGSALCLNCNARSCPNGHILASGAAICSKCGWEDHQWKYQPRSHAGVSASAPDSGEYPATTGKRCHLCGSRLDPKSAYCPACGNLVSGETNYTNEAAGTMPAPRMSTPATPPPRVESYTVTQEVIGHKDKRRNYYCPRCTGKVDDPRPGVCPHCGFVGTMQYDIYQHQPQWASNQATPTFNPAAMRQAAAPQKPPPRQAASEESKCPSCGAPNPADSRFCRTCGHRYGIGRLSQQNRSMSTEEWSSSVAASGPPIFEPIYQGAGGGEAPAIDMGAPRARGAPPLARKGKKVRVKEYGPKKFPLGLLMAVMVVVALLIGLAIFVISKELHSEMPPPAISTDTTPPVISSINVASITDNSAEITWATDEPSTSQIMLCDPEGLCTWTDPDTTLVKNHKVLLENFREGVDYHLTIKSTDQSGNEGTFERDQTFTGGVPTDKTPPAISDVLSDKVTDMGVIISWKTDEPATSKVEYGETKNYGSSKVDSKMVTQHSVLILGLKADTVYWYRVVSQDAAGNDNTYDSAQTYFKTLTAVTLGLDLGNRAPDFTLKDLAGNDVTLSSFRGNKAVMINFWYTTCNPCVAEMPFIQNISTSWSGDTPLQILAINIFDNTAIAQSFMQSKGYNFPVLIDTSNQAENLYNVGSAPTTYFLDIQGIIKYKKDGNFASQSDIEAVLNSL